MTAMVGDSSSSAHGKGKRSARSAGERASGDIRDVVPMPRLAQADRQDATAVLMPLLDVPSADGVWVAAAFLLGAIARDALGDPALISGKADALARADGAASPPGGKGGVGRCASCMREHRREDLTHGETRVLYYLPTNLSAREIAGELYLSVNTVKTHQRHLYQKLGARSRTQAVEQARALGLLAPSSHRRARSSRLGWPIRS